MCGQVFWDCLRFKTRFDIFRLGNESLNEGFKGEPMG